MGMFVRALAYMLSHGADGLRQASEDAVLNANYVRACLNDLMSLAVRRPALHARGAVRRPLAEGTGVTTLDFAKAMIDEGYHPMTMYFPLVVHGAMLIEPTESESKASLDLFIATLRDLAMAAKARRARALHGGAASTRRAAGSTRRAPRASRCCAGRSRRPPKAMPRAILAPSFVGRIVRRSSLHSGQKARIMFRAASVQLRTAILACGLISARLSRSAAGAADQASPTPAPAPSATPAPANPAPAASPPAAAPSSTPPPPRRRPRPRLLRPPRRRPAGRWRGVG